jgi:hypothetical protein
MTSISLHRASRLLEAIQKALKVSEPKATVKFSVFAPALKAEILGKQSACQEALSVTERLLSIRAEIRAAVAKANAEVGISGLLAEKAKLDDLTRLLERMPGIGPEPEERPEDEYDYRRRPKATAPQLLDIETALLTAEAAKARYAATNGEAAQEVAIGVVDANQAKAMRRRLVEAKRELDTISDGLRSLNVAHRIEIADEILSWLTAQEVV